MRCLIPCLVVSLISATSFAQSVRPLPYSSQLRTDPAVGNVQGIQRYGRPLRTDPDQGTGFSFHVYPVADTQTAVAVNQDASGGGSGGGVSFRSMNQPGDGAQVRSAEQTPESVLRAAIEGRSEEQPGIRSREAEIRVLQQMLNDGTGNAASLQARIMELQKEITNEKAATFDVLRGATQRSQRGGASVSQTTFVPNVTNVIPPAGSSYDPFDWTDGIRNAPPRSALAPSYGDDPAMRSLTISRTGLAYTEQQIYHQPLVQIKMRIVEVARTDGLQFASALEYVSGNNAENSLTTGRTANQVGTDGRQNFRGITTFDLPGLITKAGTGQGALVNLTSEHINWLLQAIAVEQNADVITAPEVVTLNGQNVEFVSGEKLPFELGQNVIQGTNNNIQQVFYKHVGTMVSVTPRIVNWGLHGEGQGEGSLQANDILDWQRLIRKMLLFKKYKFLHPVTKTDQDGNTFVDYEPIDLDPYKDQKYVPYSVQTKVLHALNYYSRRDMRVLLELAALEIIDEGACDRCRQWKPENCTIDLSVVVRLSDKAQVDLNAEEDETKRTTTAENNVRALANVIQVKSGHGVVMAGLIGESETDELRKTPILGDLPLVGFAFRSKTVNRVKTEVLIFIEAQVLDPNPAVARAESSYDFLLGQAYVEGDFLDNPLEYGMHRIGFGSYLPPHTHGEHVYWERFGRKVRKMHTHLDDTFLQ